MAERGKPNAGRAMAEVPANEGHRGSSSRGRRSAPLLTEADLPGAPSALRWWVGVRPSFAGSRLGGVRPSVGGAMAMKVSDDMALPEKGTLLVLRLPR